MFTITKLLREIRERGLENTFQRFYSSYQARVTSIADEKQIGRSRVCLDSLGYGAEHPGYADVLTPYGGNDYGFFFPPYKDDTVYVSFDHGDPSSPMVVGSYWATSGRKQPSDSELPAEFVKLDGSEPTVRGIKVRTGSGIAFDETTDGVKVEMWTGSSQGRGVAAVKHHRVSLDDTKDSERVVVASFGGHSTTWQDKVGEVYVRTITAGDHEFLLDDTNQQILLRTAGGHAATLSDRDQYIELLSAGSNSITIDDNLNSIELRTAGNFSVSLSDTDQSITSTTAAGRIVAMSDSDQEIRVSSPLPPQTITVSPVAGTSINDASPGGVTVLASAGPVSLTGQGMTMTSAGGGAAVTTNTGVSTDVLTGLETRTLLGGSVQTITGVWTLSGSFIASINALFVLLGTGLQLRLVNEDFFTSAYNSHIHLTTIPGAPTSAPVTGIGIPGIHTTIQTLAS